MASLWRPPSTGRTSRALSMTASVAQVEPSTRPMTAVRSAGYSSRGSKFDPLNQAARAMTPAAPKKEETNPEYHSREMERLVNQLLEDSAAAGLAGDHQLALEKAKEAGRRERLVCKHREQAGLIDQINLELTFAVCFNLGYQYHANGLQQEALSTYSQIMKNKQVILSSMPDFSGSQLHSAGLAPTDLSSFTEYAIQNFSRATSVFYVVVLYFFDDNDEL
ncbi:hypothetical protein Mapa_016058 [Marchantia paleacea]|nr:hypothetical protein Mapa_016058 [Marchantia paleacea]